MRYNLLDCKSFTNKINFYPAASSNKTVMIFAQPPAQFCSFERQIFEILVKGTHTPFNVTLRFLEKWGGIDIYFRDNPEFDICLSAMNMDEYLSQFSRSHWFREDFNLVILSALYTQPPNMNRILKMFSSIVWTLILISTLLITFVFTLHNKFQALKIVEKFPGTSFLNDFVSNYFETSKHLFQEAKNISKEKTLTIIWAFMTLILVSCLSSGILSSIIIQEQKNINSVDEMIDSNMDIYTNNNSWLYYQFKYKNLDQHMRRIEPRLKFFNFFDSDEKKVFERIGERKAVFIADSTVATWQKFENLHLNLEIGEEKKYYALMGHPINRAPSSTRSIMLKIINMMIEAGINVRVDARSLYSKQLDAKVSKDEQGDEISGVIIGLRFFGKIFYVLLVCLTCSLLVYLIEVFIHWLK